MAGVRVLRVRVRVLCIRVRVLTEGLESESEFLKIWTRVRLEYTVDSSPTSLLDCTQWAGYGNHLSIRPSTMCDKRDSQAFAGVLQVFGEEGRRLC